MKTFFILSLPRCRTAWLSNFLTTDRTFCFHELSKSCTKKEDLLNDFKMINKEYVGNADCGNIFFFNEIIGSYPDAKIVIISRSIEEVLKSFIELGFPPDWCVNKLKSILEKENSLLASLIDTNKYLTINYDDLKEKNTCKIIWEYCIPDIPFDSERWALINELDIQARYAIDRQEFESAKNKTMELLQNA